MDFNSKLEYNVILQRNYGIDFFKIVSMIMIAVLHVVGQGGIKCTVNFL